MQNGILLGYIPPPTVGAEKGGATLLLYASTTAVYANDADLYASSLVYSP